MYIKENQPQYTINSVAPIRICDNGGWTDTWFSKYGKIFNIAVSPFVEVQICVYKPGTYDKFKDGKLTNPYILLHIENYEDHYIYDPGKHWGKHPLIEATIEYMSLPTETICEISIYSEAPSGASMGTSAAVTVALIGALGNLKGENLTPHEIANIAHRIETELLNQQSGIQDQLCSAFGGINFIDMLQFPDATIESILISQEMWLELERRLVVVYLGQSHNSTQVHEMVIKSLENIGPDCKPLNELRKMAEKSRNALNQDDFLSLGDAMIKNTQAQSQLNPKLVNPDANRIFGIAREYGAIGWKVNGAGGDGGSVTILCSGSSREKRMMVEHIRKHNMHYEIIPIRLSNHGVRVWKSNTF